MKKIISLHILMMSFILMSCGSFDDVNTNPDKPSTVPPDFIATNVIMNLTKAYDNTTGIYHDSWVAKTMSYTEVMNSYLYNKFDRYNFDNYLWMNDTRKMLELADAEEGLSDGEKNAFKALDLFVKATVFYNATMSMGDVPCSDALKGSSEGNFTPKYDTQEEVLHTVLTELREASKLFGQSTKLNGDFVFSGDVSKWQRATNAFTLRVLTMVNKKKDIGDINVQKMFEEVCQEPLMRNEDDNFQRVFSADKASQWYPCYYENNGFWSYAVLSSVLVNMMKDLGDYRLFYYGEPAPSSTASASSFDAYSGVNPIMQYGKIQNECNEGLHSALNHRYNHYAQGEPTKIISYSEMEFNLAEAALKGWKTPMTAKEHYEAGVRAAMKFTADNTPEQFRHGVAIDDAYIDNYLKGKAAFNSARGLEQIIEQKYIASLMQLKWVAYYDYRRTGLPNLPINPETNLNEVKDKMPVRWMYPNDEYSYNSENIKEALTRQFGGTDTDTPNSVMWILK